MFPDINDLLSLDMLQKLQDNFSDATGLALVAVIAGGGTYFLSLWLWSC